MILIIGKQGQLARSLLMQPWAEPMIAVGSDQLNLAKVNTVKETLEKLCPEPPRLVFNAAAFTAVDKAEQEREQAMAINGQAPGEISNLAKAWGSTLVHFSTDYVFDGLNPDPVKEQSATHPCNHYGHTKLVGEQKILESGANSFIFRISWVFSPFGHNFVKTMLNLGQDRTQLRVVDDQIGTPMSAQAIAQLMFRISSSLSSCSPGVYHLSSPPHVSWFEFAQKIFEIAYSKGYHGQLKEIVPITSDQFPTPARRPRFSKLDDTLFRTEFKDHLESWQDSLPRVLEGLL